MTDSERKACHSIIHGTAAMAAGIGAGLAQLPGSDNVLLVPLQVGMIISLGSVFSIELSESSAKATLATATATITGRGISQVLCGWIPGLGNAINACTASAVTEMIGWSIANNFDMRRRDLC